MKDKNFLHLPVKEIKELVDELVEEKLLRLLKDPDEGLELRQDIKARLRSSLKSQTDGEKGVLLEDIQQHGLITQ